MRVDDCLLSSANLVPENNYSAGLGKIFGVYEQEPYPRLLGKLLNDLGVEKNSG